MTHEFKELIQAFQIAQRSGLKSVIASVVALNGSSYRGPGVRMLITEDGAMTCAVSGGCVENEILKQATSVFKTGLPKMMTYDGRYRLGCEGVLYILIESFDPSLSFISSFEDIIHRRISFEIKTNYVKDIGEGKAWGSVISFPDNKTCYFEKSRETIYAEESFTELLTQIMKPCFRLIIIGAEHDASHLCKLASSLGWEVTVVTSPSDPQTISDFSGATELIHETPEFLEPKLIDENTAIVLMTHNYAKDLKYLLALKDSKPAYIGMLGPNKRRERLLNEFIEHNPAVEETFFELIHGPAGLNIGAETPQEIALSICSEILAIVRNQAPDLLKNKVGTIHSSLPL